METIDTTNMCSHLQRKLFDEEGEYHRLWQALQDDPELTAVVRSRQLHIYRDGLKTLVIWRNCKEVDNEKLCAFFDKMDFRTQNTEFDVIYVNGDNTLPNMRRDEEHWKVVLTEEEFAKRMFEEG